ncbi:hypothetical protein NT04LM_3621, partial [Listeria monocytogenes FSL F2-208]
PSKIPPSADSDNNVFPFLSLKVIRAGSLAISSVHSSVEIIIGSDSKSMVAPIAVKVAFGSIIGVDGLFSIFRGRKFTLSKLFASGEISK